VLELSLILWGAAAASLGWYWGGVTEARTSWVPIGAAGVLLGGMTIFGTGLITTAPGAQTSVWGFAAISSVGAVLVAAEVGWGVVSDRTLGFGALFFAAAAGLSTAGIANAADQFNIQALGTLLAAVGGGLVFITAALMPTSVVFRRVLGWLLVLGGFGVAFVGYAPSINVTF
jgi:hypothetical protein